MYTHTNTYIYIALSEIKEAPGSWLFISRDISRSSPTALFSDVNRCQPEPSPRALRMYHSRISARATGLEWLERESHGGAIWPRRTSHLPAHLLPGILGFRGAHMTFAWSLGGSAPWPLREEAAELTF